MNKRIYFQGQYPGCSAQAEQWLNTNLVYVSICQPGKEKAFLLSCDEPERLPHYDNTIVEMLLRLNERRDADGKLIPINLELPEIDLLNT